MGLSASKQAKDKVCIDCDRKTQKELPPDASSSASKGMPCEEIYNGVGELGVEDGQFLAMMCWMEMYLFTWKSWPPRNRTRMTCVYDEWWYSTLTFLFWLSRGTYIQLLVWTRIKDKVSNFLVIAIICLAFSFVRKSHRSSLISLTNLLSIVSFSVAPCAREWDEFKQCHSAKSIAEANRP